MNAVNTEGVAGGVAKCLIYEAFKRLDKVAELEKATLDDCYNTAFWAFLSIGRVRAILGDRFYRVGRELYENVHEKFSARGLSKKVLARVLSVAMDDGLKYGEFLHLRSQIDWQSLPYGLVVGLVLVEIWEDIRYVEGSGWRVWDEDRFFLLPNEVRVIEIIRGEMVKKIALWREALENGDDGKDVAEWLVKLEKSANDPVWLNGLKEWLEGLERDINDTAWISKIKVLLKRVDYFSAPPIDEDNGQLVSRIFVA
jgi:hypothetical protein